jgi:hypothetical protein
VPGSSSILIFLPGVISTFVISLFSFLRSKKPHYLQFLASGNILQLRLLFGFFHLDYYEVGVVRRCRDLQLVLALKLK